MSVKVCETPRDREQKLVLVLVPPVALRHSTSSPSVQAPGPSSAPWGVPLPVMAPADPAVRVQFARTPPASWGASPICRGWGGLSWLRRAPTARRSVTLSRDWSSSVQRQFVQVVRHVGGSPVVVRCGPAPSPRAPRLVLTPLGRTSSAVGRLRNKPVPFTGRDPDSRGGVGVQVFIFSSGRRSLWETTP